MKPKVLLTRALMPEAVELLQADFDLEIGNTERMLTKAELLEKIQGKDVIISMLADQMDRETLDAAPDLKLIANYAVGYNNIDVPATIEKNIPVVHTPDVLTDATADIAFALLLAVARRIPEAHTYVVEGRFKAWKPDLLLGLELTGKTVGIIGMGRIGQAFTRRCAGFSLKILYYSRTRLSEEKERELTATYVSLEELLQQSDFISLHVPLTDETHHLLDAKKLALLKPDAILINTARGPVVDEAALISILKEKRIWGAGLDVYENEPHVPEELRRLDNCVLLPHIGSATREARLKMAQILHDAIMDFFAGKTPRTLVPEWKKHLKLRAS
ncbi:MAG: D-glycerate dehydrogenase [Deltaproteobacteria bacterium]|nr:D-glycerate dehydrogenase [Deltaproteobacteria bacterium]